MLQPHTFFVERGVVLSVLWCQLVEPNLTDAAVGLNGDKEDHKEDEKNAARLSKILVGASIWSLPSSALDFTSLHNVYFVKYDVTESFMAQVLDTVTYFDIFR